MALIVGIGGGSGSGKTTLVSRLAERLGPDVLVVLQHDRYYRDLSHIPSDNRAQHNFDHPDALDTPLLVTHLQRLRRGASAAVPVYDFSRHARTRDVHLVEPRPAIVIEGILVLSDARLRSLMDLKVFVDVDAPTRLRRRVERDVAERGRTEVAVKTQFTETVAPMHDIYVEPARRYADVIVERGGLNDAALEQLIALINERIGPS
jgi:uridine kinase